MNADRPLRGRGWVCFRGEDRIKAQLRHGTVVYVVPGQHEEISFHGEAISNIAEELLVGVAARQVHAHTACVTQNNRPDLE
jgi:hypothetical protein